MRCAPVLASGSLPLETVPPELLMVPPELLLTMGVPEPWLLLVKLWPEPPPLLFVKLWPVAGVDAGAGAAPKQNQVRAG